MASFTGEFCCIIFCCFLASFPVVWGLRILKMVGKEQNVKRKWFLKIAVVAEFVLFAVCVFLIEFAMVKFS